VTVPICGFELPEHPDVPEEDCPPRFASRQTVYTYDRHLETPHEGYDPDTETEDKDSTALVTTQLIKTAPATFACQAIYAQTLTETLSYYLAPRPGQLEEIGSTTRTDTAADEISLNLVGPIGGPFYSVIEGTFTSSSSQQYPPDDPDITTDSGAGVAYFFDPVINGPAIDASWDFTAPGTFTKTIPITELGTGEEVWTVIFSDPAAPDFSEVDYTEDADEEPSCSAWRGCTSARQARRRWIVDDEHTGTWFKVMWDILDEPAGWDADPPTAARSFFSVDNTWEWTRPAGTLDPEDYLSGWYFINPPDTPGTRRVVNGRAFHHRGPYGSKPTLFGEQVTLDPP
jgi:hypothetical protein